MNQILFTNNNNSNYNKVDTKKIIRFFCIAVILVVIAVVIIKVYGMIDNKRKKNNSAIPEISILRESEEEKEIKIKASCEDGIQYLIYVWNNGDENRVNLNGSTSFERIIEMPENIMNNLKVEVVSMKDVSTNKTEIFEKTVGNIKPTIDSVSIVNNKLQIQISDDTGINYLTYRWENEEEKRIDADENDNKEMLVELDIQRGTYKLFLTVVDIDGNEENLSRLITGVNEPQIMVIKYGDKVNISVTHDRGFKQIEFIINNSKYVYNEAFSQYDKNKTNIEIDLPLKEGENLVQVNAYSLERLTEEEGDELEKYSFKRFTGKCIYEP